MRYITAPNIPDDQSAYVHGMNDFFGLDHTNEGAVMYRAPAAADADGILDGVAITSGSTYNIGDAGEPVQVDNNFGRTLVVTANVVGTFIFTGMDYLGTIITENVTTINATAVPTTKAFKWLISVTNDAANGTFDVGTTAVLGLPFVTQEILAEYSGDVGATVGTLTKADTTSPQDIDSGDPRGLYAGNLTLNGSADIVVQARFLTETDDGLYGAPPVEYPTDPA